jgi:hypothetical protein
MLIGQIRKEGCARGFRGAFEGARDLGVEGLSALPYEKRRACGNGSAEDPWPG